MDILEHQNCFEEKYTPCVVDITPMVAKPTQAFDVVSNDNSVLSSLSCEEVEADFFPSVKSLITLPSKLWMWDIENRACTNAVYNAQSCLQKSVRIVARNQVNFYINFNRVIPRNLNSVFETPLELEAIIVQFDKKKVCEGIMDIHSWHHIFRILSRYEPLAAVVQKANVDLEKLQVLANYNKCYLNSFKECEATAAKIKKKLEDQLVDDLSIRYVDKTLNTEEKVDLFF